MSTVIRVRSLLVQLTLVIGVVCSCLGQMPYSPDLLQPMQHRLASPLPLTKDFGSAQLSIANRSTEQFPS